MNKIREIRKLKNLSGPELAERMNTVSQKIYRYETGETELTVGMAEAFAKALEVNLAQVLGIEPLPTKAEVFSKSMFLDTWRRAQAVLRQRAAEFDETTLDAFMEQAADYAHLPEPEFEEKLGTILNAMLALSSRRKQTDVLPVTKKKSGK